jgi:hypothetical protein
MLQCSMCWMSDVLAFSLCRGLSLTRWYCSKDHWGNVVHLDALFWESSEGGRRILSHCLAFHDTSICPYPTTQSPLDAYSTARFSALPHSNTKQLSVANTKQEGV